MRPRPAGDIETIEALLKEDERRRARDRAKFDPISGEGSIGERVKLEIRDFPLPVQWIPKSMTEEPFIKWLKKAKSLERLITDVLHLPLTEQTVEGVVEQFVRIRIKHDFAFWAASYVYIANKEGGEDILFRLNRPQRRYIARLEAKRLAGKPIRIIMLKARQWGGSTATQQYFAWLQLVHKTGLNSLIIAHISTTSDEIKDMFDRMVKAYPVSLLHEMGDAYQENEDKLVGVGRSGSTFRVPQRNCKIKIGTAENPDGCRGGAYSLVHLSEVGLWKGTEKRKAEDIVRSACTGVLLQPYTMIVYESTANGVGNFFHSEYLAAKAGESQFEALFVPWYEIEKYTQAFASEEERKAYGEELLRRRRETTSDTARREPGCYLWYLWSLGASLEAIHWYESERSKFDDHALMAAEYPSDDVEAFAFSGRKVFVDEEVETFRSGCRKETKRGEIVGAADSGAESLKRVRFTASEEGRLKIWHDVEKDADTEIRDRYLVVVDVAKGMSKTADYADVLVIDRLYMMDGQPPVVAAEWHGHIEMDRLAWMAARVARYYDDALLVIESNTLETNNTKGEAEYILRLIGDVYDNLYMRAQSAEDIQQHAPRKYGFHTNALTKKTVIYDLQVAIREHLYIEREEECLNEYRTYVERDGRFEAMIGYHDDRLMTRAIGLYVCFKEMEMPRVIDKTVMRASINTRPAVSAATL